MVIKFDVDSSAAIALFDKIQQLSAEAAFEEPIDLTGKRALRDLIALTPIGWTRKLSEKWKIEKPGVGQRLIFNKSKVMLFLEKGTGNAGTSTSSGGYIYPATKRFLFIPLSSRSIGGWRPGMVYGADYVLAKRVRGIKAMHIVENYRPKIANILRREIQAFLRRTLT